MKTCSDIRSRIIIISWWSNCLGLACLHRLAQFAPEREIDYVQVGKGDESRERFRSLAPTSACEIIYATDAPAEHSRVLREVALGQMREECGTWFIDHDLLLMAEVGSWFDMADERLSQLRVCLCLPDWGRERAITQPLFWLSPQRWPVGIANFDPVPFRTNPVSCHPDLYRYGGEMRMPEKDTLVKAWEELSEKDLVEYFPTHGTANAEIMASSPKFLPFPAHTHLGGLSLFAGPLLPASYTDWMHTTIRNLRRFFAACPSEWLRSEDPVLLERLREYEGVLDAREPGAV